MEYLLATERMLGVHNSCPLCPAFQADFWSNFRVLLSNRNICVGKVCQPSDGVSKTPQPNVCRLHVGRTSAPGLNSESIFSLQGPGDSEH